jgi:thioredoxin-like negative regulator of GroEL
VQGIRLTFASIALPGLASARVHAAQQLAAAGRDDDAAEQLQQAVAFYRSVGARRYLEQCESLPIAANQ